MKKLHLIALIVGCILLVGGVGLCTLLKNDAHMVFPKPARGIFVEKPHLTKENGKTLVQWTVPAQCERNSFEAQEVGREAENSWRGRERIVCDAVENGYRCKGEVLDGMAALNPDSWTVQVSNDGCQNGASFVSEATRL